MSNLQQHTNKEDLEDSPDSHVDQQSYDGDDDDELDLVDEARRGLLEQKKGNGLASTQRHSPPKSNVKFIGEMVAETLPTLALTTAGLAVTGELVEVVAGWKSMISVNELFILIPVLNNMKGNIEMNLSSRLSTAAFLGELDVASSRRPLLAGNLLLLQVQALLISSLAGGFSFLLGKLAHPGAPSISETSAQRRRGIRHRPRAPFHPKLPPSSKTRSGLTEFIMVVATAMSSAGISALTLGSFMCTLVVLCRRFGVNPDNVAPPVASALGDLVTLSILSIMSTLLLPLLNTFWPFIITIILFFFAGVASYKVLKNPTVKHIIWSGWVPLIGAMLITSGSGLVLDQFVNKYDGFGLLAIVISGLPGGVGSVFISRISTSLHASTLDSPGYGLHKSPEEPRLFLVGATLFAITFPVQILFLLFLHFSGWMEMELAFVIIFMIVFSIAVVASLTLANYLTHFLWSKNYDPDMYAMPIQSSMVDLIGQCLLLACFEIAIALGEHFSRGPGKSS